MEMTDFSRSLLYFTNRAALLPPCGLRPEMTYTCIKVQKRESVRRQCVQCLFLGFFS